MKCTKINCKFYDETIGENCRNVEGCREIMDSLFEKKETIKYQHEWWQKEGIKFIYCMTINEEKDFLAYGENIHIKTTRV